jgi:hypothetical protein
MGFNQPVGAAQPAREPAAVVAEQRQDAALYSAKAATPSGGSRATSR